jgi:putative addiction module killer protein
MVPYMLPITQLEYHDARGRNPYRLWFDGLNVPAGSKVGKALYQLARGNFSNVKSVGEGVSELKVDFGPGYRVYFGHDGKKLVILLGGGTKKRQQRDIADAHKRWADYRLRRKGA